MEDENLEKCIIPGMSEGTHNKGRPWRKWFNNIKDWANLSAEDLLQLTKYHTA